MNILMHVQTCRSTVCYTNGYSSSTECNIYLDTRMRKGFNPIKESQCLFSTLSGVLVHVILIHTCITCTYAGLETLGLPGILAVA
jgi:hypothetical protein